MIFDVKKRVFHFKQPAGTSRGIYLTRKSWFITLDNEDGKKGVGECAPLPDLSIDALPHYEEILNARLTTILPELADAQKLPDAFERQLGIAERTFRDYPSMRFGLETALLNLHHGERLFDTPFSWGEEGIPINGLVWMGSYDEMEKRMEEKIEKGFHCVKIKIGAIRFDEELELLRKIRKRFSKDMIEIRTDANGAFLPAEAMDRLQQLARFHIHSIEQPIRQHQWHEMAELCRLSPVPIALDEELIGLSKIDEKNEMLEMVRPQYIVLKPSLHGGIAGCREWIELADKLGVKSWMTSALESNVGLNAIAQFAAHVYGEHITFHQGLGTGQLFNDNTDSSLSLQGEYIWHK